MENQLIQLPEEVNQLAQNVSIEKRNEVQTVLNHVFNGVTKMREQLDVVVVENENDKVNMKLANAIRLGVRQVRLDAEKTFDTKRAEVQQQMLSYKTEDSLWLKAKQTMQILTKEIEENARWKEETRERFEKEQKELKIQQRILKVSEITIDINRVEFENMSDESFETFLNGLKSVRDAKIEAERKAEEERQAQIKAEQDRIESQRIENERLKAEAEAREKELEAERIANAKKLAEEQAKAKAEADKLRAENEAKLKKEQEAKAKLEAELKAKQDAEAKAKAERQQAELKVKAEAEKLAKAPIKKQLTVWIDSFSIPEINIDNEKTKLINDKFQSFKEWAKKEIESL